MNTTVVILIVATFLLLGFRLYKKYIKKGQGKDSFVPGGGSLSSHSKDDDYEPYSKK